MKTVFESESRGPEGQKPARGDDSENVCVIVEHQHPDRVTTGYYLLPFHSPRGIVHVYEISRFKEEGFNYLKLKWMGADGRGEGTWNVSEYWPGKDLRFQRVVLP